MGSRRGAIDCDDGDRPVELVRRSTAESDYFHQTNNDSTHSGPLHPAPLAPFDPYGLLSLERRSMSMSSPSSRNDESQLFDSRQQASRGSPYNDDDQNHPYYNPNNIHNSNKNNNTADDAALAAALQMQLLVELREQEEENIRKSIDLALEMQKDEEESSTIATSQDELHAMTSTPSGKAWILVERVLAFLDELRDDDNVSNRHNLQYSAVPADDLVFLAERMFDFQDSFRLGGKPTHVDIGYHFTSVKSLEYIKTDGLLSKVERSVTGIESHHNGSKFGDGIYTANTPYAYQNFGDVGILCARLKGEGVQVEGEEWSHKDCGIARGGTDKESAILGSCSQCLPLVYFQAKTPNQDQKYLLSTFEAVEAVYDNQERLQRILDELFNSGEPTPVRRLLPKPEQAAHVPSPPSPPPPPSSSNPPTRATPAATSSMPCFLETGTIVYEAPDDLSATIPPSCEVDCDSLTCSICLGACNGPMLCMDACGHTFHRSCIEQSTYFGYRCPDCRAVLVKPQGHMPSARMEVLTIDDDCEGFNGYGSIVINYLVPSGVQKCYHQHPGVAYAASRRRAFIPNSKAGRLLARRLKYAFRSGLTFRIGRSLTTGKDDVVTWGTIHHKSSRSLGPFGYPDCKYFRNCNEELDALGIPGATDCPP